MRFRAAFAILLSVSALHAETPATQTFPAACSIVEHAALPFFSARSIVLIPQSDCQGCFIGKTSDLHDAVNKKVSTSRAMHIYMEPTTRKSNPIVWYAHSSMDTVARLTLKATGDSCQVGLLFNYSWYGAQFIVVMPVDGDPESRPSNLRLEHEYLAAMQQQIATR
jgi:hypothetical protein